jgi:hypothetical protein
VTVVAEEPFPKEFESGIGSEKRATEFTQKQLTVPMTVLEEGLDGTHKGLHPPLIDWLIEIFQERRQERLKLAKALRGDCGGGRLAQRTLRRLAQRTLKGRIFSPKKTS